MKAYDIYFWLIISFSVVLTVLIFPCFCLWRIAKKTNTPHGWLAWIPGGNIYIACKIGRISGLWCFVVLGILTLSQIGNPGAITPLSLSSVVILCAILFQIPKTLNIQNAGRILIVVPVVNYFYLGYLAFREEAKPELPTGSLSTALVEPQTRQPALVWFLTGMIAGVMIAFASKPVVQWATKHSIDTTKATPPKGDIIGTTEVEIPGVGMVEFPASMSMAGIEAALRKQFGNTNAIPQHPLTDEEVGLLPAVAPAATNAVPAPAQGSIQTDPIIVPAAK